jgi:hypothetical protein
MFLVFFFVYIYYYVSMHSKNTNKTHRLDALSSLRCLSFVENLQSIIRCFAENVKGLLVARYFQNESA